MSWRGYSRDSIEWGTLSTQHPGSRWASAGGGNEQATHQYRGGRKSLGLPASWPLFTRRREGQDFWLLHSRATSQSWLPSCLLFAFVCFGLMRIETLGARVLRTVIAALRQYTIPRSHEKRRPQ